MTPTTMKRSSLSALLGFVVVAQLCVGCTVTRLYGGVPLRGDPKLIVPGESTRADVLRVLGPPDTIEHQAWGDAFIYRYRQVNSSSITIREPFVIRQTIFQFSRTFDNSDTLVVLFGFDGIVNAIAADQDTEEMPLL